MNMPALINPDEPETPLTEKVGSGVSPFTEQRLGESDFEQEETLELREEQLVAHKELLEVGEITVRTELDEVPGRLEVDAYCEEIVIEHEPVGQVVSERDQPREHDGVLIMPVYEEQLVVVKRLVLKERLHIRRVATTERQLFEDTLRRERLVIDDPQQTGLVREQYPMGELAVEDSADAPPAAETGDETEDKSDGGLLEHLVRKALA